MKNQQMSRDKANFWPPLNSTVKRKMRLSFTLPEFGIQISIMLILAASLNSETASQKGLTGLRTGDRENVSYLIRQAVPKTASNKYI